MSTTSPSHRRTLGWPLALLVASLAITVLAAVQATLTVRRHRATAEQLLRDYAAFAAWSYQRHAGEEIGEAAWFTLNPILHRHLHDSDRIPESRHLPGYLARSLEDCRCRPLGQPGTYWSFALGADTLNLTGPRPTLREQRWLVDTVTRHVRDPAGAGAGERMAVIAGGDDERPRLVAYGLMPTIRNDTIVYGFTFDPTSVPGLFREVLATRPLLPPAVVQGRSGDSLLAVRVTAPGGGVLYASAGWPDWTYLAADTVRARNGGLVVEAAVRPALVNQVLEGGLPRSRLPFLVGSIVLAGALALLAIRQVRRERELARVRSEFVSSVSHELRTPLAQIRLFLETLRLGRFADEAQREWLLGHLDRETLRLSHLVENLLRFSRPNPGPASTPAAEVDVSEEAAEVVRAFEPLAASRRVVLETDLEDDAVALLDREAFRQVLLNLLDNAVKFGPTGQRIAVRVEREMDTVRVSVTDQGPGIPAAERERAFEPFVRGADDATRAVGGSGIGLAVVRDAVHRHGGRVRIEDAPTGGTRVVVELPAIRRRAEPAPSPHLVEVAK